MGVPGVEDELGRASFGLSPLLLPLLCLLRVLPSCPALCASAAAAASAFLVRSLSRINLQPVPCRRTMLMLLLPGCGHRLHAVALKSLLKEIISLVLSC